MAISAGQVIEGYLRLREKKGEISDRHKEELAPINEQMMKLEAFMLNALNAASVDSMAFKGVGTMFKQLVTSVTTEDWEATLAWIKAEEAWEFLEHRVSKTVVQEYAEAKGETPPGIKVAQDVVVRVRKS